MLTLTDVRSLTAYSLATHAGCGTPDTSTSEGAQMLSRVRDDVIELVESYRDSNPDAPWSDLADAGKVDYSGEVSTISDGGPSVYTYTMWQQFVDLAAYQEDPTELGSDGSDMAQAAGLCLYIIADRLAWALLSELSEQDDDAGHWEVVGPDGATLAGPFTSLADADDEAEAMRADDDTPDAIGVAYVNTPATV